MRIVGLGLFLCVSVVACATGGPSGGDTPAGDGGTKLDSGTKIPTDSGTTPKDSGTTPKDSGTTQQDSGNNQPCGGQCLGSQSTCCTNTCVDTATDPNNCGSCGNACGAMSCCSSSCVDTMGSDNQNCGGCGVVCNGTCVGGSCQTNNNTCTLDQGSCAHSPCTTGGALTDTCDSEGVTFWVCDYDLLTYCCSSTWDQSCVDDAAFWEANSCVGGGC